MGVAIAARAKHPGRYQAMVLVEGGHDRWTPGTARAFADAGGRRVLFGCGQPSCFVAAKRAATHLERAGVTTKVVGVKDAGHSYGGAVAREVQAAWTFVTADPSPPGAGAP
jgi:pimeloyl-ACP methyl ester carboxylesterase